MPLRAVIGGVDSSGEKIYIGRAKFEGGLLPGKIVPSHGVCYVSHQGGEHAVPKYQVLVKNKCCDLTWVPAAHGEIPNGALQGGFSPEKEPVYIARAMYDGATAVGMVRHYFVYSRSSLGLSRPLFSGSSRTWSLLCSLWRRGAVRS